MTATPPTDTQGDEPTELPRIVIGERTADTITARVEQYREVWSWHEATDDTIAGWGTHRSQALARLPQDRQTDDMLASIDLMLDDLDALLAARPVPAATHTDTAAQALRDESALVEHLDQSMNASGETPHLAGLDAEGTPFVAWLNEEGGDSVYLAVSRLLEEDGGTVEYPITEVPGQGETTSLRYPVTVLTAAQAPAPTPGQAVPCHVATCVRHFEGMHVDSLDDAIIHVGCADCTGVGRVAHQNHLRTLRGDS